MKGLNAAALKQAELQLKALRRAYYSRCVECRGLGPPTCPGCSTIREHYNEALRAYDEHHDLHNPVVGRLARLVTTESEVPGK